MFKYHSIVLALATSITFVFAISPRSSVSYVPGTTFDRFVIIWMENTDYAKAIGDPKLADLAKKGITLSNYMSITHPSEPNYVASVSSDTQSVVDDSFNAIDSSVKTVVDILEAKVISWGEYQEDMPSTGYTGTQAGEYVRKHNPLVMFDSVANNPDKLACIKPLSSFTTDLDTETLPQWIFITPNLINDGHDTSVTTAGAWVSNFITPLLENPYFNNNTLVYLTFDESHNYFAANRVLGILLGDIVPSSKVGSIDSTSYNHYSLISTISQNWNLGNLGKNDVDAEPIISGIRTSNS